MSRTFSLPHAYELIFITDRRANELAAVEVASNQAAPPATEIKGSSLSRVSRAPPATPAVTEQDIRNAIFANTAKVSALVEAGKEELKSRYDREPVDGEWASKKQKALQDINSLPLIGQANAGPLSFDTVCRTSVCLIGADFSTVNAADDWFDLYTMLAGKEMSRAAVAHAANPDGTVHVEIYGLARGKLR